MNEFSLGLRKASVLIFFVLKLSSLKGQVLVHEEPLHRPVFQNNEVRMLDVRIPPNDTSQFHIHHTPSVFIFFTNTNTGSQLQGKEGLAGKSIAGRILFENLSSPNIRIHRVWNADKDSFHVMDIELLYKDTGFVQQPLTSPELKLEVDEAWARAYRLVLPKGKDFKINNKEQSFILVFLNASIVDIDQAGKKQHQKVGSGSFFIIERGRAFSIRNLGEDVGQFALLELPKQ